MENGAGMYEFVEAELVSEDEFNKSFNKSTDENTTNIPVGYDPTTGEQEKGGPTIIGVIVTGVGGESCDNSGILDEEEDESKEKSDPVSLEEYDLNFAAKVNEKIGETAIVSEKGVLCNHEKDFCNGSCLFPWYREEFKNITGMYPKEDFEDEFQAEIKLLGTGGDGSSYIPEDENEWEL